MRCAMAASLTAAEEYGPIVGRQVGRRAMNVVGAGPYRRRVARPGCRTPAQKTKRTRQGRVIFFQYVGFCSFRIEHARAAMARCTPRGQKRRARKTKRTRESEQFQRLSWEN